MTSPNLEVFTERHGERIRGRRIGRRQLRVGEVAIVDAG
jgi:hypothetical protein